MKTVKRKKNRRLRGAIELWTPPTLAPGDVWEHTCWCGVWVQGGRPALDDHNRVVHG